MSGWLEKVKLKLNSTQVTVEVEVRVELGKNLAELIMFAKIHLGKE